MAEGGPSNGLILDASVILAVLYGEPGEEEIRRRLRGAEARVGTMNLSEVVAKLAEGGFHEAEVREAVGVLGLEVVPFDEAASYVAGLLRPGTKDRGLSLGDRACVALARTLGATALTMERAWEDLEGVEVIRRGGPVSEGKERDARR